MAARLSKPNPKGSGDCATSKWLWQEAQRDRAAIFARLCQQPDRKRGVAMAKRAQPSPLWGGSPAGRVGVLETQYPHPAHSTRRPPHRGGGVPEPVVMPNPSKRSAHEKAHHPPADRARRSQRSDPHCRGNPIRPLPKGEAILPQTAPSPWGRDVPAAGSAPCRPSCASHAPSSRDRHAAARRCAPARYGRGS